MVRPLRLEFAGALYHVTSRGDRREDIYENYNDRDDFLSVLATVCETYNWVCHAYCLMNNHSHGRVGHVFQGRYKAILVEKESYLLELSRYIVLNPVRAAMVLTAGDWPWSSYRATAGLAEPSGFLTTDWLLSGFSLRKSEALARYQQFISEGKGQPSVWKLLRNQVFLGSDMFVERAQSLLEKDSMLSEIPSSQRRPLPKSLDAYKEEYTNRNTFIIKAYESGGYTLKEIGDYIGLHYSTVSGIIKSHKSKT